MILGFKQTFPWGKPTKFKEKILCGVLPDVYSLHYKKKIHSIRKGSRWKPGMSIQMAYGVRTSNYEQFNKDHQGLQTCISVQNISISPGGLVLIDGRGLNQYTKNMLAENDGFESFEYFMKWFKDGMHNGQLIHWTDYRY